MNAYKNFASPSISRIEYNRNNSYSLRQSVPWNDFEDTHLKKTFDSNILNLSDNNQFQRYLRTAASYHKRSTGGIKSRLRKLQLINEDNSIKSDSSMSLKNEILEMNLKAFEKKGVKSFWYIASIQNLESISKKGILSHNKVKDLGIDNDDISDPLVQRWRNIENTGMDLQNMVPLYINPKNPMFYKLRSRNNNLCLLEIDPWVLASCPLNFSDGNAASAATNFYQDIEDIDNLPWEIIFAEWWHDDPDGDGTRKRMAEVLINRSIQPKYILGYHFYSETEAKRFKEQNNHCSVYVSISAFFQ
jgi:hypothetical protein